MSLALLFHYLMLNMFRMLVHPSSEACDFFVELFHWLYCSVRIEVFALAYANTKTSILTEQYNPWNNSTNKSQVPEDGCTNIRNMLSSKWWNNKASDIKLVYLYSTIKMIHGPINIKPVNTYALSQNSEKWLLAPSCLSVYQSAWNSSASTSRIFKKSDILVFFFFRKYV